MSRTLVIFDIDGTLLFSNKVDSECFAQAYESQFGKPFPTIDWRKYPHVTDHTIFNTVIESHFGRPASFEDIQKQQEYFVQLLLEKRSVRPEDFMEVPGAKQAIGRLLADEQFAVGIATGGWRRPAMIKMEHLGFPVHQLFASFADNKLTREEILTECINNAQLTHQDIQRIVYVGDAEWDITTTRNMQLNFVGVRINGDHQVLQNIGASAVVQNYSDFDLFMHSIQSARPPI